MTPELRLNEILIVDLETPSLNWWTGSQNVLAAWTLPHASGVLDLRNESSRRKLRDMILNHGRIGNHNIKFDFHHLIALGVLTTDELFQLEIHDSMVYAALLNEHLLSYSLEDIGQRYVGEGKDNTLYQKFSEIFGGKPTRKAQMPNMGKALEMPELRPLVESYAMQDTKLVAQILPIQLAELERQDLLRVRKLEMDLLPVLTEMEHGGVRVDLGLAERAVPKLTAEIDSLQRRLNAAAGFPVGILSPKSMQFLFNPVKEASGWWRLNDGTLTNPTESGKAASIDANCLRRASHPAAALILECRNLTKIRDTFLLGHVLGNAHNGRVHTNYNQTKSDSDTGAMYGTSSGRLSSNEPNLQQISVRNQKACEIVRACFLPDEGAKWLSGDFSQIDFRFVVHFMNDPLLVKAYAENPLLDFHTKVAEITGLPRNPTPTSRACAKTINLGLAFGMSEGRLAEEMGMPFTLESFTSREGEFIEFKKGGSEAQLLFERYHGALPELKPLLKAISKVAKDRGYVRTILGRRCRFPGGQKTHKAGPLVFQGGAAELMKVKLVELRRTSKETGSRMMLTIHDSDELSGSPDAIPALKKQYEENTLGLRVPICSEWKHGNSWWEVSRK